MIVTDVKIISVLEAQHVAIDNLMARLIVADHSFRPSQSGAIWEVVEDGHNLIQALKAKLK